MDALKNITGGGSDKPKAEETKPGFIDNTKSAAASAQTAVTGAATNVVETAKGYGVAGQEAVGKVVTQAQEYLNKPAEPKVEAPVAKKEESGNVVGDAAAKVGGLFNKK